MQQRPLQYLCSTACAIKYTARNTAEANFRANFGSKKELKERLKTRTDYEKDLQKLVNQIARLIDRGAPCVSSLRPITGKCDGGHRFSTGSFPALRFNLFNIHAQSVAENQYRGGNPDGYDHGLSTMYGDAYVEMVHGLKKKYPVLKLTQDELKEAIKKARILISEILCAIPPLTPDMRIKWREAANNKLNIYKTKTE